MRWTVHPASALGGEYGPVWRDLQGRAGLDHPLLDLDFVAALLEHFAAPHPALLVATDRGALVGAALMRRAHWGRWESFLPGQAPVAPLLLDRARHWDAVAALPRSLPGFVWQVDLLAQDPLLTPGDESVPRFFQRLPHVTTMNVLIDGTFESYWQARPGKLRNNVNRYLKRLERDHLAPSLVVLEKPGEMAEAVARYGRLESSGWKGASGTAVSAENAQGRFYASVLRAFACRGGARVFLYFLGDQLAAARLVIQQGGIAVALKTAYEEQLADYAPGRLLLHTVLRHYFEAERVKSFEFYTNATADQLHWASASREIFHLELFRSPGQRRLVHRAKGWIGKLRGEGAAPNANS